MAVRPTYPGVYVQEVPSGVRTISGVSTSVALFVGFTKSGPVDKPTRCFSYTDYVRAYGDDTSKSDMTQQVRLAFLNGLTEAWVLRIAKDSVPASIELQSAQTGKPTVLTLTARSPGEDGSNIRALVDYATDDPESTFNLTLFRWVAQPNGTFAAQQTEVWSGLSMDPDSPSNAASFLTSNSSLVTAVAVDPPATNTARSIAMSLYADAAAALADWDTNVAGKHFSVSVNGSRFVDVQMPSSGLDYDTTLDGVVAAMTAAFDGIGAVVTGFDVASLVDGGRTTFQITSTDGDVRVRPGSTNDVTAYLKLGSPSGGLEIGRYAKARPVPNSVTVDPQATTTLFGLEGATDTQVKLHKYAADGTGAHHAPLTFTFAASTSVSERLAALRDHINLEIPEQLDPGEVYPWRAELWGLRLAIVATDGPVPDRQDDNRDSNAQVDTSWTPELTRTVRRYSLGTAGAITTSAGATFQLAGVDGADGTAPEVDKAYADAFLVVEREVDLFNLLILPRAKGDFRTLVDDQWSQASVFAEQNRALLIMEPPETWKEVQGPANEISTLRGPLSKQYAAIYYPRMLVREGKLTVALSPVGAVAGIMARTDTARGVWKAPAGTEAGLRGIVGLEQRLSDAQNGALNPLGINCLRQLPDGFVVWGARTLDGYDAAGSEYKYVPIRRLANFIEESLFRGLRWVVFEPNDEPLWAQIRLNVGAFMHDLFRKGAFQGTKPSDAYFVRCDSETTSETDRNLGIVNIWVGFAPLKPAEFVVISLQQMAGQSEV